MEKTCSGCKKEKCISEFYSNKSMTDGLSHRCSECSRISGKKYRENNKEKIKQYTLDNSDKIAEYKKQYALDNNDKIIGYRKEYYKNNSELLAKKNKEWYIKNKDKVIQKAAQYRKDNKDACKKRDKEKYLKNTERIKNRIKEYRARYPGKKAAWDRKRELAKINRTPAWADDKAIQDVYADCVEINLMAKAAGCTEKFVVDHEIPLQGELVSGLHVHYNLQIITATSNSIKGNKFTPGRY